jgi:hypothetical protein
VFYHGIQCFIRVTQCFFNPNSECFPYLTVQTEDHNMGLYVRAIGNVLGLKPKVGPQRLSLPPAVAVNEAGMNAAFLESVQNMQLEVAADSATEALSNAKERAAEAPAGPVEM